MTADLIDFLRARLDDDEHRARYALTRGPITKNDPKIFGGQWYGWCAHAERHLPDRVLREVAAKRALLEYADGGTCGFSNNGRCLHCDYLRILAAIYADHPAYRAEWTPA